MAAGRTSPFQRPAPGGMPKISAAPNHIAYLIRLVCLDRVTLLFACFSGGAWKFVQNRYCKPSKASSWNEIGKRPTTNVFDCQKACDAVPGCDTIVVDSHTRNCRLMEHGMYPAYCNENGHGNTYYRQRGQRMHALSSVSLSLATHTRTASKYPRWKCLCRPLFLSANAVALLRS